MEIGISLGNNIGDRLVILTKAKKLISTVSSLTIVDQSPVYETEPVNVPSEFSCLNFLNAILIIETMMSVSLLLSVLRRIERKLGRTRNMTLNKPRLIDIDIIYADQLCIKERNITIPHPRWADRRFVVQPLHDVRPALHIPGQAETVADVLSTLTDSSKVSVYEKDW